VAWPLSHEFIWGAYGSKGIPVLFEVLEESNNPTELRSAMHRLTQAQYLPSIARIRHLAVDKRSDVRRAAVMSLGKFGHPDDYEFLIDGLKSTDPDDIFAFAFALYEFDDERAAPHLLPHLKSTADNVRLEVSLALLHLLTPETLAAVERETPNITNTELRKFIERSLTLRKDKLPADYSKKNRAEQALILAKIREDRLFDSPSDKKANESTTSCGRSRMEIKRSYL
jgi:HEAT repeat protein